MKTINQETGEITTTPFLRTQYNYNRDDVSHETGTHCEDETLTQQQFKDECDINNIMDRFGVTGGLPYDIRQPITEDFVEAFDYQTAQNAIRAANESFAAMPANVRARFQNDPQMFIEYFNNEDNREEAEKLGLVNLRQKTPDKPPEGTPEA